jgi:hypothetical protein
MIAIFFSRPLTLTINSLAIFTDVSWTHVITLRPQTGVPVLPDRQRVRNPVVLGGKRRY